MSRDGVAALAVLAASLLLFWLTLGIDTNPLVPIGPAFYPRIVLGLLAAMCVMLLVTDILRMRRAAGGRAAEQDVQGRSNYGMVGVAFAVIAVYIAALPVLGFRIGTLLFVFAFSVALDRPVSSRQWGGRGVLAFGVTAVTYLVFQEYLSVLLPRGTWTDF